MNQDNVALLNFIKSVSYCSWKKNSLLKLGKPDMPVVLIKVCCVSSNSLGQARDQESRDLGCEPLLVGALGSHTGPGSQEETSHPQPHRVAMQLRRPQPPLSTGVGLAWPWLLWLWACVWPQTPAPAQQGRPEALGPAALPGTPLPQVSEGGRESDPQGPDPPAGPIPAPSLCCWWVRGLQDV